MHEIQGVAVWPSKFGRKRKISRNEVFCVFSKKFCDQISPKNRHNAHFLGIFEFFRFFELFKGPAVTTNGAPGSRPGKYKVRKVHNYMMQSTKRADILTLKTTSTWGNLCQIFSLLARWKGVVVLQALKKVPWNLKKCWKTAKTGHKWQGGKLLLHRARKLIFWQRNPQCFYFRVRYLVSPPVDPFISPGGPTFCVFLQVCLSSFSHTHSVVIS